MDCPLVVNLWLFYFNSCSIIDKKKNTIKILVKLILWPNIIIHPPEMYLNKPLITTHPSRLSLILTFDFAIIPSLPSIYIWVCEGVQLLSSPSHSSHSLLSPPFLLSEDWCSFDLSVISQVCSDTGKPSNLYFSLFLALLALSHAPARENRVTCLSFQLSIKERKVEQFLHLFLWAWYMQTVTVSEHKSRSNIL